MTAKDNRPSEHESRGGTTYWINEQMERGSQVGAYQAWPNRWLMATPESQNIRSGIAVRMLDAGWQLVDRQTYNAFKRRVYARTRAAERRARKDQTSSGSKTEQIPPPGVPDFHRIREGKEAAGEGTSGR